MAAAPTPKSTASDDLDALPRTPATSVKTLGWRGVMQGVHRDGAVLVTNHDRPEAVILSTQAYLALARAAKTGARKDADVLETLRARFDERLAALQSDDAGDRLRAVMDAPAELHGEVRAGASH
ncbi:MAG TPA: prevent-host-death protein [Xanthomonadaceae bacterium]|nr:prevent-host-death protein [Xanthomonadaceae bacterium]